MSDTSTTFLIIEKCENGGAINYSQVNCKFKDIFEHDRVKDRFVTIFYWDGTGFLFFENSLDSWQYVPKLCTI